MSNIPQVLPVVGAKPGTLAEVMPGKKFVQLPSASLPEVVVAEVVPQGEGTFRLVGRVCPRWFTVKSDTLAKLGIGISRNSMKRLIRAGFVEGQMTIPGVVEFNYHSYLAHHARASDPEFWDQTDDGHKLTNRERLRKASANY